MKLVTFKHPSFDKSATLDDAHIGVWIDTCNIHKGSILDLNLSARNMIAFFADDCIDETSNYIARIQNSRKQDEPNLHSDESKGIFPISDVELLAPIPQPTSLRDFGVFKEHMDAAMRITGKEMPPEWYKLPNYYRGSTSPASIAGHEAVVTWPNYTEKLDFELEWGIYIGKQGKNISIDEAPEYIAGYTIYNDISARDIQFRHMTLSLGPAKGKDFDNSNIMGPCLVTPDEIGDPYNLNMIARVNGEIWSEGNTSDMYYSFAEMISFVSQSETLFPGDFLGSGTVGKGCGWELDRWIQPGDVIELEVENIGVLRNRIGEPEQNPAAWKEKI